MTRISLKEQYDNSSVVKQIADLTDQIDGYDETIEQATQTATDAKTTATEAKSAADTATTKNTEQDSRLDSIEAKDKTQDSEIAVINSKDSEQDLKIETLQQAADTAAKDIDAIESAATDLTNRVDGIESDLTATEAVVAANQSGLATAQGDIVALKGRTTTNEGAIATQASKNTEQDSSISALQTLASNIASHLISNVAVKDGTANGAIMVELIEENGSKITSPNYAWGRPNTFQLVQGSEAGYLRGKLILSDGTEIESNDFQILQVIESDVYVTSITLTPYPTTGKLGGTIGYSNGNTAQINPVDVPTAPGVTSNINDLLARMGVVESGLSDAQSSITSLTSRMTNVEAKNTAQDNQITALQSKDSTIDGQISSLDSRVTAIEETPGIGAFTNTSRGTILGSMIEGNVSANSDGTGSVSGWSKVATAQNTATAAQNTADSAVSAAALAQSTANDANNKADGCFDSVQINTANDGLVFKTPSDQSTEVILPSQTSLLLENGYIEIDPISLSDSSSLPNVTVYLRYMTNTMIRKGKIIPLAEFNQSTGQSLTTTCYVFKTDILKNNVQSVATKIFNAVHSALDDGSYRIYFCPFFTSNEIKAAGESCFVDPGGVFVASEYTNYANMAANNYPVIDLTISDGELISYSVPSVAGGLFVPSTVVTKIGLLSIGSL